MDFTKLIFLNANFTDQDTSKPNFSRLLQGNLFPAGHFQDTDTVTRYSNFWGKQETIFENTDENYL